MIRLVCIDVDGTLVGTGGAVHPEVWPAAARARAAGIRLAICSGRAAFGLAREYAQRSDADGWHCFQNGASIVHLPSARSRSTPVAPETVASLIARARATGRVLELYSDDGWGYDGMPERSRAHAALLGVPFRPRPIEALNGPIVRAQWLVSPGEVDAVLAEPHPGLEVSPSTSPVMPDTVFVNLTLTGIDKASALRILAAEYGIPLARVMFVGDGHNDNAAMRIVGYPVAMGNAEPETRAIARRSVATVDAGGLTEALELAIASRTYV